MGRLERVPVRPNSKVILPYEPGYTGHWEMEKRRKETREWLRERGQQVDTDYARSGVLTGRDVAKAATPTDSKGRQQPRSQAGRR